MGKTWLFVQFVFADIKKNLYTSTITRLNLCPEVIWTKEIHVDSMVYVNKCLYEQKELC